MELTLYTRGSCHLCEEMKAQLEPLLGEFSVELREVDVDTDAMLAGRFGEEVPVLLLDGRKVAKHRLDVKQLRRRLQAETAHHRGAPFDSAPTSQGSAQGREDTEKARRAR